MSTESAAARPPLVILDRDGVINVDSDSYIKSPAEWVAIPGSLEAIARLNHAGILVTVATNQSGLARGLFDINELNQIHAKFQAALARVGGHVDGIFFCPHGPDDGCDCRKPRPGMLLEIGRRFRVPLEQVPFIGDSPRDAEAALAAGAIPILLRTDKRQQALVKTAELQGLPVYDDLSAAVDALLGAETPT